MIALYKDISPMSRMIRIITWSEYSHAAWIDPMDDSCWEALPVGGVTHSATMSDQHRPGTPIELYPVYYSGDEEFQIRSFMAAQLHKPYDWHGVVHFLDHVKQYESDVSKWFCSELVFAAHLQAGINLQLRIPAWKVSPALISYSTLLPDRKTTFTHHVW